MKPIVYMEAMNWLRSKPAFEELCARYPVEWEAVQQEIAVIAKRGIAAELKAYLGRLSVQAAQNQARHGQRKKSLEASLSDAIHSYMAHEAVKKLCLTSLNADAGVKKGKLRFNWFNGFIIQNLLFSKGLERKPASLFWFRLWWPLLWQKKRLMPLVQPKGIYCFYSRALIVALKTLIASRSCLEIAAGDGTLTRFLQKEGVALTATDNHGWKNAVNYPEWVIQQDARAALAAYAPEVVICSWPPAENDFERDVFNTPSVQLYIVIGSRHQIAFGNWKDYQQQSTFALEKNEKLGAWLLPPELGSAVYLFSRKPLS